MTRQAAWPTPWPDVNAFLHALRTDSVTVLDDQLVGLYVEGSLGLGDFDPAHSDIDVVAVTTRPVSLAQLTALQALHERLAAGDSRWALDLEASWVPRQALRRYDPARARFPRIERGPGEVLRVQQHEIDWLVHLHVLREHGIALLGPPPAELIDPVGPDELRAAMVELMRIWWAPMDEDPTRLRDPGYRAYAVVTQCRMLYTLAHGRVVSKSAAARWAQAGPLAPWAALVDEALAWSFHDPETSLQATRELIRFTARRCATWTHARAFDSENPLPDD